MSEPLFNLGRTATTRGKGDFLKLHPGRRYFVYEGGTDTPAEGWMDEAKTEPIEYPLRADRNGRVPGFFAFRFLEIVEAANNGQRTPWGVPGVGELNVIKQEFNVRFPAYDAKGDGGTDDLAAFTAVLADAGAAGGRVTIPGGVYRLSGPLPPIPLGVDVVGDGASATVLMFDTGAIGSGEFAVDYEDDPAAKARRYRRIENLSIRPQAYAGQAVTNRGLRWITALTVSGVWIEDWYIGLYCWGDHQSFEGNARALDNYYGVYFPADMPTKADQTLRDVSIANNRLASIGIEDGVSVSALTAANVHFGYSRTGIYGEGSGSLSKCLFDQPMFENVGNSVIELETGFIDRCFFREMEAVNDDSEKHPDHSDEALFNVGGAITRCWWTDPVYHPNVFNSSGRLGGFMKGQKVNRNLIENADDLISKNVVDHDWPLVTDVDSEVRDNKVTWRNSEAMIGKTGAADVTKGRAVILNSDDANGAVVRDSTAPSHSGTLIALGASLHSAAQGAKPVLVQTRGPILLPAVGSVAMHDAVMPSSDGGVEKASRYATILGWARGAAAGGFAVIEIAPNVANKVLAPEPWRVVGETDQPAYESGFVAGAWGGIQFRKLASGMVVVEGQVNAPAGGTAAGAILVTLPAGYWPASHIRGYGARTITTFSPVEVRSDGTVRSLAALAAGQTYDLSISFSA